MIICIVVSADTVCRVVLCDIAKVLTHAFTKCSLGVANVLFVADCASEAINDIIGLAIAVIVPLSSAIPDLDKWLSFFLISVCLS